MKAKIISTLILTLFFLAVSAIGASAFSISLAPVNPQLTDTAVCEIAGSGVNPNGLDQYLIHFILMKGNTPLSDLWDEVENDGRIYANFPLSASGAQAGDTLHCHVYKRLSTGDSTLGYSNDIFVQGGSGNPGQNDKNGIAKIYPAVANKNDNLVCKAEGGNFDPNSVDQYLTHFIWERKTPGQSFSIVSDLWDEVENDGQISSTILASATSAGDEWRCTVAYRLSTGDFTIGSVTRVIQDNVVPAINLAAVDPLNFSEDTSRTENMALYITDADGDAIDVEFSGNTHIHVSVAGMTAVFTADQDWFGLETLTVRADDKNGGIVTAQLRVNVTSVNDAPVLSLQNFSIPAGQTVNVDLNQFVADVDDADSTLLWTITGNTNIAIVMNANKIINVSSLNRFIGSEMVTFNVSDPWGATAQQTINITALPNSRPTIAIVSPINDSQHDLGSNITFSANAADAEDNSLTITWASSINGLFQTGNKFNYSALSAGTHIITATATDSWGATASDSVLVRIVQPTIPSNDPLVLTATPSTGIVPLTVQFRVTVNGQTPQTYVWDFGDGSIIMSNGHLMTHVYIYAGNYAPRVVGFYVDGTSYTATTSVIASAQDTIPQITIKADPAVGESPLKVKFKADVKGNAPFSYVWDFTNDGTDDSILQNPEYTYKQKGVFTAKLTVTDADGDNASATAQIDTKNYMADLYVGEIYFINGETVYAGEEMPISIRISNDQGHKQNLKVAATIDELGIRDSRGPFELSQGDEATKTLYLEIPGYAQGSYDVTITISNDDMLRVKHRTIYVR